MELELSGLRVIVTAAGGGIGQATATMFADAGAAVHVCDVDPTALARACVHDRIEGIVADVGETAAVDGFMEHALSQLDGIDVLVNNAGIAGPDGRMVADGLVGML